MATDIRSREVEYPSSDGKPMADNTLQFQWIVTLVGNLDAMFRRGAQVFVAGDLLWYPVEGEPKICAAPDTMVVFGRPKGHRLSYKQWEEGGIGPQVTFETLSQNNTPREMAAKKDFSERHGVQEYYQYDPDRERLRGWIRRNDRFEEIPNMNGWVSPLLGIRFEMTDTLCIYGPDEKPFLTFLELQELAGIEQQRAQTAEQHAKEAEQRAATAENAAEKLRAILRARGIDPQELNGD